MAAIFQETSYLLPEASEAIHHEGVRFRRTHCYPDGPDDRLFDAIERLPKVAPHLDLPLQHIDDDMLRRMISCGFLIEAALPKCIAQGHYPAHHYDRGLSR